MADFIKPPWNRPTDGMRSAREMLHEITFLGTVQECSRKYLLHLMPEWVVDLNVNRLLKDGLIEQIEKESGLFYRVKDVIFKEQYVRPLKKGPH